MTATRADVVLDASVVARGLMTEGSAAEMVADVVAGAIRGHAPDLIVAEVSSALAVIVRTERRSVDDAQGLFQTFALSPIELHPSAPLAPAAIELAATTRLSAYDAFYAVLARALEVPLVTADTRLAAAVVDSVLVE